MTVIVMEIINDLQSREQEEGTSNNKGKIGHLGGSLR